MFLFTEELNMAVIAALVAIITAIAGFIIAIFKNENLRIAMTNRLVGGIRGGEIITINDLVYHDIIVKIKKVLATGEHNSFALIHSSERRTLFKEYMEIICNVYLDSINIILKSDFINYTEADLKILVIEQMAYRRVEISQRLQTYLLSIHNDRNKVLDIATKLEEWRAYECKLISDNVINTISSGRFLSVAYKLDVILHQYAIGVDIIISKGAVSFEQLNGELDSFLENKK